MYHDTNQEIHLACGAYDVVLIIRFCWLLVVQDSML